LRRCEELDFDYCVVLGVPKYYERFGFKKASTFGMRNESGVDEEFIVIRFSGRVGRALVQHASEFAMFFV
jgi:putative acetyltransferase